VGRGKILEGQTAQDVLRFGDQIGEIDHVIDVDRKNLHVEFELRLVIDEEPECRATGVRAEVHRAVQCSFVVDADDRA
jgi:hypothetical protein